MWVCACEEEGVDDGNRSIEYGIGKWGEVEVPVRAINVKDVGFTRVVFRKSTRVSWSLRRFGSIEFFLSASSVVITLSLIFIIFFFFVFGALENLSAKPELANFTSLTGSETFRSEAISQTSQ